MYVLEMWGGFSVALAAEVGGRFSAGAPSGGPAGARYTAQAMARVNL
jgi:hypothetical protein